MPVSYTHLDVYKRQEQRNAHIKVQRRRKPDQRNQVPKRVSQDKGVRLITECVKPVSYTHLDVYKRQDTDRIMHELEHRRIVIVTGFQGVNKYDNYTTLGRGGSDTTAVALAAALHADACEIYTDVDGVYTADPRVAVSYTHLDILHCF